MYLTQKTTPVLNAFQNHLTINSNIPPEVPLFAWETTNGWAPMTKAWFMEHCNQVWQLEGQYHIKKGPPNYPLTGLGECKGHTFRIGSTTHLLLLGVEPMIVMVIGRWSSKVFLGYWCNCNEILAMFVRFSMDSLQSVITTMSNFKATLLS